ncbi:EF-hand domain-containing protein [Sandaracinobacter neustonicus]|uniref:EF-hand domain-containing protein n=1 Tax=Sandaracinobacter neustonicus TaxID=1715348 RepID=A0A501XM76_9SPHN|nr:EF-hand domain-containing protein [Sandaracinobacter neustonicus]TPE61748.1 EF-hand domain-containing protein [Sandaracinobacter neustonicus]
MIRQAMFAVAALLAAPALAQQPPAGHQPGRFFDATDTNKDGVLSKAEWEAAGRRPEGFAMMDADKDGKVTKEEGRAAMQKMMQQRAAQQPQ